MSEELMIFKIRKKLIDLCNFTEDVIKRSDLVYEEGLTKGVALGEISEIRNQVQSSEKFTIAFVGEYDAGKTSIINLLTGKNLAVSSTVTTQVATEIQWKDNLTIVDTPGLGSGQTEHDEITTQWLAKADLLIYVLTPDLFNTHSGERLLTMLERYKRDHELMLVMNMIDQEGNDLDVYHDALRSVIAPKDLDEFFPAFISAKYKKYSMDTTLGSDEREYYLEKSRFDSFLKTLDSFVMDRREKSSLTTPLTRIYTLLHKIGFKNKFDQENTLLDWKIRIYGEHLGDIKRAFGEFQSQLRDYASGAAGDIFGALDNPPSDFQQSCQSKVDDFIHNMQGSIETFANNIGIIVEQVQKEGEKIDKSDLANKVYCEIQGSETLRNLFGMAQPVNGKKDGFKGNQILQEFSSQLKELGDIEIGGVKLSGDLVGDLFSSKNFFEIGSTLIGKLDKGIVTKIGHALGKKFKPWEAVKLTSNIGKGVPILNLASVAWEVISAVRAKRKKKEADRQLSEFKSEMRRFLGEAASKTTDEVNQKLVKPVETVLASTHKMLQDKKGELIQYSEGNATSCAELECKKQECIGLYDDIYRT